MDEQNHDTGDSDFDFGFTPEDFEEFRQTAEAQLSTPMWCPDCDDVHPFALCPLDDWSDL